MSTLGGRPTLAGPSLTPNRGVPAPGARGQGDQRVIPAGCVPDGAPELTQAQARAVLRDAFERIRRVFLDAGADKVSVTRLEVSERSQDGGRHFAACRTDGGLIVLGPQLALMPPATIGGIIAHEFGHAVDDLYPGSFLLTPRGTLDAWASGQRSNQAPPGARLAYWNNRSDDQVEATADAIAERLTGWKIGYLGPCRLQAILRGGERGVERPRPPGLR